MTQERSAFEVLQALAPRSSSTDLELVRAKVDQLVAHDQKAQPLPRRKRAYQIRRPMLLVAASVALVAAGLGIGVLIPADRSGTMTVATFLGAMPAAASETEACGTHPDDSLRFVPRDEWSRYPQASTVMVGLAGPAVLGNPLLGTWEPSCTAAPVAVFYDGSGGRGLTLYRDVANPFAGLGGLKVVTVRDVSGTLLTPPSGLHMLTWTDRDGVRWLVEAGGMSQGELLAIVDELALDGPGPVSAPSGFASATIPSVDPDAVGSSWTIQYGPGGTEEPQTDRGSLETIPAGYTLVDVRSPALAPVEAILARRSGWQLVGLDGTPAAYQPQGQGGATLRWVADGAEYRLVVAGADLDELQQIARSLAPIRTSDVAALS